MKTIAMTLLAGLTMTITAHASDVVISRKVVKLPVDIAEGKVKLSRAGYSMPLVKILVPELAGVTLLDNRNVGEGAPCMASYDAKTPEDIIQNNPQVEEAQFVVTLTKTVTPDTQNNNCQVSLTETLDTRIRGHKFTHQRFLEVGTRNIEDCK